MQPEHRGFGPGFSKLEQNYSWLWGSKSQFSPSSFSFLSLSEKHYREQNREQVPGDPRINRALMTKKESLERAVYKFTFTLEGEYWKLLSSEKKKTGELCFV